MKREIDMRGARVNTPWGIADFCMNYGEGIDCFGTPGHGGFRLSAVRRLQMPVQEREARQICKREGWPILKGGDK